MDVVSKSSMGTQEERSAKSSDKLKMLDITRDKPIKVSVKVAVPVRDHPKFNFVGKLLGPKGHSMKRLQEDTMCKMAVLGRGSMRDRRKEEELRANGDSRYAHLFEDLHVEISTFAAPAEAHARIAYALAEVRRFLVPDYHDDIRQEQMWEMQAMASSPTLRRLDEQQSPSQGIHGSFADLDTPTDDKSDTETSSMDCITVEKTEDGQTGQNSEQHQHFHALLQHGVLANGTSGTENIMRHTNPPTIHPTAITLRHQLNAASLLKPPTSVAAVTGLPPTQPNTTLPMPSEVDPTTSTLALLEPPGALLHPALRGVKAINISTGLGRKRPLLGVPRSGINPTKRTVMTLLARAKNSQAMHSVQNPIMSTANFANPLQMLNSPFIIPQAVEHSMITLPKKNIAHVI